MHRGTQRKVRRAGVLALGRECGWHAGHAAQVARLVRQFHRQVPRPQKLAIRPGPADEWLEYAALLHDIGYIVDVQKHHKHAERIVREASLPGLLPYEVTIIALMVRCHRKKWPGEASRLFAGLGQADYETVRWLTALLRVADGLDRTHTNAVREVVVTRNAAYLGIGLVVAGSADSELWAARNKSDLLTSVLGCPVLFRLLGSWNSTVRESDHGWTVRETQPSRTTHHRRGN